MIFDFGGEDLIAKLAGVAGALSSLAFIKGSMPERFVMAAGGATLSYYGSGWMSSYTGLPTGLSGFLLGLFGMAVCAKAWEVIRDVPVKEIWLTLVEALRKKMGL